MKQTGVAILGAGRWGKHLVRNFLAHPDACLVAVVDPYPETLAAIRDKYNLAPEVRLATDWESIRDLPTIEAVVIATPAVTHYTLIKDALQQGKHVLAEKPLTLDVAQCLELCHLAQENQRQLMVDHTYLFHPAVKRAQEVVNSRCLGDLRYGYASRTNLGPVRQDVDSLWDLAIHDIAIFNHCLRQLPVQVQANGRVWLQFQKEFQVSNYSSITNNVPYGNAKGEQLSTPQGLADLVQVTLTYPTGFQAFIHLCWLNPDKQRRLGIVGTQGTLIFDEMVAQAPLTIQHGYFEQNGEYFIPAGQHREVLDLESLEPLYSVCDRFLNSIRLSQPSSISSGWVGAQLVQILTCLSQSLHQGGVPVNVPQLPK